MRYYYFFISLLVVSNSFGQINNTIDQPLKFAETITIGELKEHLQIVASDALEGRETGKRGQKMAAAYIKSEFQSYGLDKPKSSSFYQILTVYSTVLNKGNIKIRLKEFICNTDFFYSGSENSIKDQVTLLLVGKGDDDYLKTLDLNGKSVLIIDENQQSLRQTIKKIKDLGARHIFLLFGNNEEEFSQNVSKYGSYYSQEIITAKDPKDEAKSTNLILISPSLCEEITGLSIEKLNKLSRDKYKNLKPSKFSLSIDKSTKLIETENVLGVVEGGDLKEEVIVISCHYDHIGVINGKINNGADDDGSGITALLELAEAFSLAKSSGFGPRRTIVFIAFTGEEKGLLGSAYYADHPIYDLENTIANLNIDMIGRIDEAHKNNGKYVYLVGTDKLSSELHDLSEKVNTNYTNLNLDYAYNDERRPERIYYRSDHWNFAKNNIPVIFYISGFHEDYHKPTDTIEKIEFEALQQRTKLIFHTAWELANMDVRPKVDKVD